MSTDKRPGGSGQRSRARKPVRTALLATFAAALISQLPATPHAEAATLTGTPIASCTTATYGLTSWGRISVHPQISGSLGEQAAVSMTIQRWNGSAWRNYRTYTYLTSVNTAGSTVTNTPQFSVPAGGHYRVIVGLAWNENGHTRTWGAYRLTTYRTSWGWASQYCTV